MREEVAEEIFFIFNFFYDYTANVSSNRCFEWSIMQLFEPMCENSAVGFPDFLEDNWQPNGCVPLRIDCSALF